MIPPNISSDSGAQPVAGAATPDAEAGVGLTALVGRLAEEFGVDSPTLALVASVYEEGRARAPDIFVPTAGAIGPAFAALADAEDADAAPVYAAIGEFEDGVESHVGVRIPEG